MAANLRRSSRLSSDGASSGRFVGRQSEQAVLQEAFREAESGRPRLVLIAGDAGMGKTRLLREFRLSLEPGAMVLHGHCYEESPVPYVPFVEVLRSCLDQRPNALDSRPDAEAAAINRLLGKAGDSDSRDESAAQEAETRALSVRLSISD